MTDTDEKFLERLNRGPAGLLLGQRHLALGATSDPFLAMINRKLDKANVTQSYSVLHSMGDTPALLDWLDSKSRTLIASEQLEEIALYPWVSVWSSAIDSLWADTFETASREVQRVFTDTYHSSDPRSRRRLHCAFLFGSISRSDEDERPPTTKMEYLKRRATAQSLARAIPAVLGPTGTLAIEAYGPMDWFKPEDLIGVIAQMQAGQCHLFSATDELLGVEEIAELVNTGLLVAHDRNLATVLSEGVSSGTLTRQATDDNDSLQRLISFQSATHSVPRDVWVTLSGTAHLLDESILINPRPLSPEATYSEFRRFLGSGDGKPDWEGISRDFAFRREFEIELEQRIHDYVAQRDLHERPIIVHGATGTGKTVALTSLAYHIARQRKYPTLFIDRRTERFDREIVDRFSQWAENNGADASVVFWDGMHDPSTYEGITRFFAGRGRRIVLVGSTYRVLSADPVGNPDLVFAPSELDSEEIDRLEAFLASFDEHLSGFARLSGAGSPSFLAFLYRLLPPTRASMRRGVVRELERVERIIVERSRKSDLRYEPTTTLGWALFEAGLIPNLDYGRAEGTDIAGEHFSAIEDLTSLIMIPAQFGLAVPLEIVLRASSKDGYAGVAKLLGDVDLIRWVEDRSGNFMLTARSTLEAQIIVRSRLATPASEAAYARRLLVEVRDRDRALSGSNEINFAVSLARAFGAQGTSPDRYIVAYRDVADALRELREERGVTNPHLMLQESNLLREWSIKQPIEDDEDRAEELTVLTEAANILATALDDDSAGSNTRLRSRLHVELASTLAAHAQTLSSSPDQVGKDRSALFSRACAVALQARTEDPGNYYPVDVLAWATRDAIRDGLLNEREQAEAISDVLNAFELLDPLELDVNQVERYHQRHQEFAELAGQFELANEAFAALAEQNSGAGVYLRARAIAAPAMADQTLSAANREAIERTLEYMSEYADLIAHDVRCLNLKFDLWWLLHTGQRPFANERFPVAFSSQRWREALSMIEGLEQCGQTYREVPLLFLRGLAEFHLQDYAAAFATFDEVTRRSDEVTGRRRIVRTYIASGSDGRPMSYTGTVLWTSEDRRRGEVQVDRLRRRVLFIPKEFTGRDLTPRTNLGDFHISFNFLGILADPPAFLHSRREMR